MQKSYHIERCHGYNNRPETDRWFVVEWFIPTLYEAREQLALNAGGDDSLDKWNECIKARVGEVVLGIKQTFDMFDTKAYRIVEAVEE